MRGKKVCPVFIRVYNSPRFWQPTWLASTVYAVLLLKKKKERNVSRQQPPTQRVLRIPWHVSRARMEYKQAFSPHNDRDGP